MQQLKTKFLTAGSGLTLAAIIALLASPVRAEKNENSVLPVDKPAAKQETVLQPAVAAQGIRVYRDPQTGRIGPPPVGVEPPGLSIAEQHMLNRSDEGLRQRTLPGGSQGARQRVVAAHHASQLRHGRAGRIVRGPN